MAVVIAPFPLSLMLAGRTGTGESYLTWQLFRRPNHDWLFYPATVPEAIGPLVLLAAVAGSGCCVARRRGGRRCSLSWIAVPVAFFELWPVKGFQYLLPIAPALARAGRARRWLAGCRCAAGRRRCGCSAVAIAACSALADRPTWHRDRAARRRRRSSPGPAGCRAAARRALDRRATCRRARDADHRPVDGEHRRSSTATARRTGCRSARTRCNRNPLVRAADQPGSRDPRQRAAVRRLGRLLRRPLRGLLASACCGYVERYDGRVIHAEMLPAKTALRRERDRPAIVVYEVRP